MGRRFAGLSDAGSGAGAEATRRGGLLLTDMPPIVLARHAIGVIVSWMGIVMSAHHADAAAYGGPAAATLWFLAAGLIPTLLLHMSMFDWLAADERGRRLESRVAKLEEIITAQAKKYDEDVGALKEMVLALKARHG